MADKTPKSESKIEVKSVKHTFNPEERNEIGSNLARSIATESFKSVIETHKERME